MEETFGAIVADRREKMGLSLWGLSGQMGGTPGPSFLSRLERGEVDATQAMTKRLARILNLPMDASLNAAGFASEAQMEEGLEELRKALGDAAPVLRQLKVYDPEHPKATTGEMRQRLLRARGEFRIVDLADRASQPWVGEVIFDPTRRPRPGIGVVAEVEGRLGAWTYQKVNKREWIENSLGEKRGAGYDIRGVIVRVTTVLDQPDE